MFVFVSFWEIYMNTLKYGWDGINNVGRKRIKKIFSTWGV